MAKKKPTRKALLKEPDEFLTLSARFFAWTQTNRRKLQNAGIVVGILIALYMAGYFYYQYTNKKAQNTYNEAYSILAEAIGVETEQKKLQESEKLFRKVIESYSISKACRLAFPQAAYISFEQGKYDQAISLYQEFLKKISDAPHYQILTEIALAACFEQKGDLKAAEKILIPLSEGANHPFKEFAILALARVFRMDNQKQKSEELLRNFIEEFPQSPFLPMAKAFL